MEICTSNLYSIVLQPAKKIWKFFQKRRNRKITLQEVLDVVTPFPTIVIPCGNDDSVNHAVCVVDDLIFDSTQPYALKLTRQSFDWICGDGGCGSVYLVLRFMRGFCTKTLRRDIVLHKN